MRILHTSDWHVGRTIRGRSRADEHEAVLAEIVRIAQAERADLVLIAGDQFDTAAPTPEAERIVYRALLDLADTDAQVVVIAGNHDQPHRLAAVAPLLASRGIHARALLARPDEGGVLTVRTRDGETALVALVPFLSQRHLIRAAQLMAFDADQHAGQYDAGVRHVAAQLTSAFTPDTVNLVCAHLFVAGGTLGGGEREAHTIFDYAVSAATFPAAAHYVALGHLHRAQRIPAACPVHYCGSPLQLDFGEAGDDKAVMLVEARPGTPAEVRTVPLRTGRRLRTIRGTLEELEALTGATSDDHLRVVVRGQARAGLADAVRALFPDAVEVVVESPDVSGTDRNRPVRLGRRPGELFAEYLAEHGADDERVRDLFSELLGEEGAPAPDGGWGSEQEAHAPPQA
ncbi:MAG: exonuclease SbcCD subunit D [Egibacteraceae bacterium]